MKYNVTTRATRDKLSLSSSTSITLHITPIKKNALVLQQTSYMVQENGNTCSKPPSHTLVVVRRRGALCAYSFLTSNPVLRASSSNVSVSAEHDDVHCRLLVMVDHHSKNAQAALCQELQPEVMPSLM